MKILSILKKELVDGLRDRRALLAALSFALLGPVLIVFMINATAAARRDEALAPIRLCGPGSAPALVAHLKAAGLTVSDSATICLDIPADYAEKQAAGRTARIRVIADLPAAGATVSTLERAINVYAGTLAAQRLMTPASRRASSARSRCRCRARIPCHASHRPWATC